ncbi:hypothetical protein M409DRAFT_58614 [Zasmidium cellare ATCC 36951]|uniref:Anaphase-promoting complex subunit 4 n=1 Tax=Zasmidium cellare ATCC 36951 TaxID=1080233 RepID=A0A6A6C4S9_ZASCE|nr:uncharacterized protein M409DRAFT_58614 [Zasmidium cellare ATCC 36951]KAF2162177.1 hypothetical protein M409DRAFT_58614 [Zasmidium cellare ATCC 36951]
MAQEESSTNPRLDQLTSKRFPAPIKFPFTAYSHCHDLLAIVTSIWDVNVFRITNGQLAYHIKQIKKEVEVTALSWKADGTCLGIGWSNGHYAIHDGGTGKQMQLVSLQPEGGEDEEWLLDLRIKEPEPAKPAPIQQPADDKPEPEPEPELAPEPEEPKPEPLKVGCFGWMGHEAGRNVRRKVTEELTTDDWYDGLDEIEEAAGSAKKKLDAALMDLPRAITTLDVTKVLPKLSNIQTHSTSNTKVFGALNKFGNQQATNTLFHTRKDTASNVVQSVLVCQEDGVVQVFLDETVKVGSNSIPGKPIMHAAHPESASHAILSDTGNSSLTLNLLDLPLQALSGPLLHVIGTNNKRIQVLLEYIVQTVRCIEHDFTTSIALPQRLIDNLSAFLETELESDPVLNLFNLAMTGGFNEPLKEWFTNAITRRHKDWEQTINSMYTHLQNHVFINLLPALDRMSIALTTLRGLANFYEGSSKFDCPAELFTKILEHVDSLRLVAQKMQLIIQMEHRQFRAFYKWVKMDLEIAIAGPLSNSALEIEDREVPNLDYALLLPYIKETLMRSRLTPHVETRPEIGESCSKDEFFQKPIIQDISYERTKEALQQLNGLKSDAELKIKDVHDPCSLLNLPALTAGLIGHVRLALTRITEWQSRMLSHPTSIPLPLDPGTTILDMKMSSQPQQDEDTQPSSSTTSLLALQPGSKTDLHILHITHYSTATGSPSKRPSPTSSSTQTTHFFPAKGDLLDAKWIPYTNNTSFLTLFKFLDGHTKITKHSLSQEDKETLESEEIQHVFAGKEGFRPVKLIVGGRKGRLVCVVLGNRGREWRVLDLDGGVKMDDGDGDEMGMR